MVDDAGQTSRWIAEAAQLRQSGREAAAHGQLEQAVAAAPGHPGALNALGLSCLRQNDAARAVDLLQRAVAADPGSPALLVNLADAYRAGGDPTAELATLDEALARDAYFLPALFRRAQAEELAGDRAAAARTYRVLLRTIPDRSKMPPEYRHLLDHGDGLICAEEEVLWRRIEAPVAAARLAAGDGDLSRVDAYIENFAGRRRIYQPQPLGPHFPFLPAYEFFDRRLFAWMDMLEEAAPAIRAELLALWSGRPDEFAPYVDFAAGIPTNQWEELNRSARWGAWFLWKDGAEQPAARERCPATMRALDRVPLLDLPGKGPTAMFSILDARTRIPPHTGSTNVRTTVHLALVVPEGCHFRVGGETRPWREGHAWAFDDTIEHEALNNSDRPRAVLILDVWNPLLTDAEKAVIRAANAALIA